MLALVIYLLNQVLVIIIKYKIKKTLIFALYASQ